MNVEIDLTMADFVGWKKFGLAPLDQLVVESVRAPHQRLRLDGSQVQISRLDVSSGVVPYSVLTICSDEGTRMRVLFSIAIPREVVVGDLLLTLHLLAGRFGSMIVAGKRVGQLFVNTTVPHVDGQVAVRIADGGKTTIFTVGVCQQTASALEIGILFAIDVDHYALWRQQHLPQPLGDVHVEVAEQLKSRLELSTLLESEASITAILDRWSPSAAEQTLFSLKAPSFELRAGIVGDEAFIVRNGKRCSRKIAKPAQSGHVAIAFAWSPTSIHVASGEVTSTPEVQETKLTTDPTLPPRSLVTWLRHRRSRPAFLYATAAEVHAIVLEILSGLEDKVTFCNMQKAFWNRDANDRWTPKRETDAHHIVEGLIFDACVLKNITCTAEPRIEAGHVDFLFTGVLSDGQSIHVCVEFKNAHATDLTHGLQVQLPAYMDARGGDYGIYCVLFYRCDDFDSPSKSMNELRTDLETLRASSGRHINVLPLNLALVRPPSKR